LIDHSSLYQRSLDEPEAFWAEQSASIDWHRPFDQVCDYSDPPFARWFVGGQTNLCNNAVDRHLAARAEQSALIWASSETDQELIYSYGELHAEVQRMAAVLQSLGVQHGDRVLIYLPMVPQAVFAMLACARIGAIHCVVFGGFASASLASRIDDAQPVVIISADAGSRSGKVIAYKPLLDEAMRLAAHPPAKVLLVDRGLCPMERVPGRDEDYASLREAHLDEVVP
jgi:propionyl-CoA synthetase